MNPIRESTGVYAENDIHARNIQSIVVTGDGNTVTQVLQARSPSPVKTFKDTPIVVARPSPFFKGRDKIMQDIDGILTEFQGKMCYEERTLVVHGYPGIGKSELMRQFAQEYESKYPNTAWINADSPETIEKGFKTLAKGLKIEWDNDSELEFNVTKVYKHIEHHCVPNSTVIILDNVKDQHEGIYNFLPVAQSIRTPPLIVMTATEASEAYRNLQVRELNMAEALEVLQKIMKLTSQQMLRAEEPLKELAILVGCHPLSLVISASYLSQRDTSRNLTKVLQSYMERVRTLSTTDFANYKLRLQGAKPYTKTLRALWKLTMERIEELPASDVALKLLCVLGYVDPENVDKEELRQLCVRDCPLIDNDDGWTTFFSTHDDHQTLYDGIKQLTKLSVLMPISSYDDERTPHYRTHRLLQLFALEQDVKEIGLRRALHHCIDNNPPFIYPGCLEYLKAMMSKSTPVDEKFKQMCIALAITAKDTCQDDTLAQLMSHFEKVGGNADETQVLLKMAQLRDENQTGDACSAIETMSRAFALATKWIQSGYGTYLIQYCALKIVLNALFTSPKSLDGAGWPEDFFSTFKRWLIRQINLLEELTGEERKKFSKIFFNICVLKTCRTLDEVLESSESLRSLEDFESSLVCKTYRKFKGNADLEDGYWHVLSGFLRINACSRFLKENMKLIVKQAAETLAASHARNCEAHDGFLDCLLLLALEPEFVSSFCSDYDFLFELDEETRRRVRRGFSLEHKDIYWGIFFLVACIKEPDAIWMRLSSWNPWELPELRNYFMKLSTEAAYFYRRWILDKILGGFHKGKNLLLILEDAADSEPEVGYNDKLNLQEVIAEMARTFLGIVKNGPQ